MHFFRLQNFFYILTSKLSALKFFKYFKHDNFDDQKLKNDIALLVLSEEVNLNKNIKIACLPISASSNYPVINVNSIAVGWGLTSSGGSPSDKLRNVDLTIYDGSYCDYFSDTDWNKQICAGFLHI